MSAAIPVGSGRPLAQALTRKTERLCAGLAEGEADILELVTPTTGLLLRWWFEAANRRRRSRGFRPLQRQAILNIIVAHEVLGAPTLRSLYEMVAPAALSNGERLLEILRPRYFHPSYCIGAGNGGLMVLQALLIWQLLNKIAALRQGGDDSRFTQNFLLMTSDNSTSTSTNAAANATARERLRHVFVGDTDRAALLMPPMYRDYLLEYWRGRLCDAADVRGCTASGTIAIAGRLSELPSDALGVLTEMPDLMLFDTLAAGAGSDAGWQKALARVAAGKGRRFVRLDLLPATHCCNYSVNNTYPPHIVADLDAAGVT